MKAAAKNKAIACQERGAIPNISTIQAIAKVGPKNAGAARPEKQIHRLVIKRGKLCALRISSTVHEVSDVKFPTFAMALL